MEWEKLLSERRIRELLEGKAANKAPDKRTEHGRDYDRAIFSTPVRRMQDKTQVFPLDPNDSVRTRLTHSLEVSNIARNMARGIGNWLLEEDKIDSKQRDSIEIIATTCGLIHDLGNPPFGHAGEKAIQEWFECQDEKNSSFFKFVSKPENAEQLKKDFLKFEGNAQTIRLISKLQVLADFHGLNFTCATMSAACKYIASASEITNTLHEKHKLGYFTSEQGLIKLIQEETGTENIRNPITYIVESADDIAYSVVDIEDGVKKGVIGWDDLEDKLEEEYKKALTLNKYSKSDSGMLELCFSKADKILGMAKKTIPEKGRTHDNTLAQAFRVFVIIESAKAIEKAFKEKYKDIMDGNYHGELYKDSEAGALIEACKKVGQKYIYCSKETLKLELMGRRVIHDLMDIFWEGATKGSKEEKGFERKIFDLTSRNYLVVYGEAKKKGEFPDKYCSMQLMTDYICGMTDTFACTLHKRLTNG
ncbi:dGTP triphosphohydrolase [Planctomycetota bacterium]